MSCLYFIRVSHFFFWKRVSSNRKDPHFPNTITPITVDCISYTTILEYQSFIYI